MPENARRAHPPPFASLSRFPHRRRPLALRMHRRHPEYTDDLVIPLAKAAVAGSFLYEALESGIRKERR